MTYMIPSCYLNRMTTAPRNDDTWPMALAELVPLQFAVHLELVSPPGFDVASGVDLDRLHF